MNNRTWLSKQARDDFQIVRKLAEVIGLADCPPYQRPNSSFIANQPLKRDHTRRVNQSDLLCLERTLEARRVLASSRSSRRSEGVEQVRSSRKGAVRDVFVNSVKPEEDPVVYAKTKKMILHSDMARARRQALERERVGRLMGQKRRRSKILKDISGVIAASQFPKSEVKEKQWFSEYRHGKAGKTWTFSQEKLEESFDCSKFRMIAKGDGVELRTRGWGQRRTQTAMGSRAAMASRTVDLCFNDRNNRAELVYPRAESRAQL